MPFPGSLSRFDRPTRADGAAHAGTGATVWDDVALGGGASGLIVTGNRLAVSTPDSGALTVASESDFIRIIQITTASGFFGYFWRIQDAESSSWSAYWFVADGVNWAIRKRVSESTTTLDSATVDSSLGDFERLAIEVDGTTMRVYRQQGGFWAETPVLEATDSDITSAGPTYLNLGSTSARIGDIETGDLNPTGPVTIWVDADHPDATDDLYRDEVSESTPFATPQAAAYHLWSTEEWADELAVKYADNANPEDPHDTSVYGSMDHRFNTVADYPAGWPRGDNEGYEKIVMRGVAVGGKRPKIKNISGRFLRNWQFGELDGNGDAIQDSGWQQGYDRGATDGDGERLDVRNLSELESTADLMFAGIHFTGGAFQLSAWHGDIELRGCEINAPLPSLPDLASRDGRGMGGSVEPGFAGGTPEVGWLIARKCTFKDIRGNDAIQIGQAELHYTGVAGVLIEDSYFFDVYEGFVEFHTDAIQILGCPEVTIRRSWFIGCTNLVIASDWRNGVITVENCFMYGGTPVTVQGTNELRLIHNTFLESAFPDSSVVLFTRATLPEPMKLVAVNNIVGGFFWRDVTSRTLDDESLITNNLVLTDPGGTTDSTPSGTHLPGLPEFGISPRLEELGLPTEYAMFPAEVAPAFELANTPNESPGIGQGYTELEGLPTHDILGREYAEARDVGCFQSDPEVEVTPVARRPYVISRSPSPGATGVADNASVVVVFYPKPGETIDEDTLTSSTVLLEDPAGYQIPATIAITEPDEDGYQTVTLNLKRSTSPTVKEGTLYPLVVYTATIEGIRDTEASEITPASWEFRVAGPDGPAIYSVASGQVALNTARSAAFFDVGATDATFFQPTLGAEFEQPH